MIQHVLVLLVVSYVAFFFISSVLNPFKFSSSPFRRRQFKLGRAAALVSLASGILALALLHFFGLNERVALATYLIASCLLIIPSVIKYRQRALWR